MPPAVAITTLVVVADHLLERCAFVTAEGETPDISISIEMLAPYSCSTTD